MKKSDVQIGHVYTARVTNKVVHVRINAENPNGGWDATNLSTGKQVRIKSAQRLREKAHDEGVTPLQVAPGPKTKARPRRKATSKIKRDTGERREPKAAERAVGNGKAKDTTTTTHDGDTGEHDATLAATDGNTPRSLLDAAARVLAQHDEALGCREMVNRAIESGLWNPRAGKTPANTLNAAIAREIATKGDDARFRKAERGKFTLA